MACKKPLADPACGAFALFRILLSRRILHSAKVRLRATPFAQDDTRGADFIFWNRIGLCVGNPRFARTTEKSTLSRAFLYILSEQNVYVHIKNLGKNREQPNIGVACAAFPFGNRLRRKVHLFRQRTLCPAALLAQLQ